MKQDFLRWDSINILLTKCGFQALLEVLNDIEPELMDILSKEFESSEVNKQMQKLDFKVDNTRNSSLFSEKSNASQIWESEFPAA
ncbi:hypothetical protein NUACC21_32310 [Scytonema sp. NUACC21]